MSEMSSNWAQIQGVSIRPPITLGRTEYSLSLSVVFLGGKIVVAFPDVGLILYQLMSGGFSCSWDFWMSRFGKDARRKSWLK